MRRAKYMKFRSAFSLVEILISMVIMAILGTVVLSALWFVLGMFSQNEDYVGARSEIENAFQYLTPQITNIGLGMPNNSAQSGSFNAAFKSGSSINNIMEQMGDTTRGDRTWGGPATIAINPDVYANAGKSMTTVSDDNGIQVFAGPVLYYAWAVPTGVHVRPGFGRDPAPHNLSPVVYSPAAFPFIDATSMDIMYWSSQHSDAAPNVLTLTTLRSNDVAQLTNFMYDGRMIGIQNSTGGRGSNIRSWMVLPTLRVPLLIFRNANSVNTVNDTIEVQLAPYSFNNHNISGGAINRSVLLGGAMWGYEEIHLVQAASLFVNNRHELIQRVFMGNPSDAAERIEKVLARNIAAVCFRFDPRTRILTMYVAARGTEGLQQPLGVPSNWPVNIAPLGTYFTNEDLGYRIQIESMTWRIRN